MGFVTYRLPGSRVRLMRLFMLHRLTKYLLLIIFSCSLLPALARAQPYYTYLARIETDSFILAWGGDRGRL